MVWDVGECFSGILTITGRWSESSSFRVYGPEVGVTLVARIMSIVVGFEPLLG